MKSLLNSKDISRSIKEDKKMRTLEFGVGRLSQDHERIVSEMTELYANGFVSVNDEHKDGIICFDKIKGRR